MAHGCNWKVDQEHQELMIRDFEALKKTPKKYYFETNGSVDEHLLSQLGLV
jgi:hypothetical protein